MIRDDLHGLEYALHVAFAAPRGDATLRVLTRWRAGDVGDPNAIAAAMPLPRRRRWQALAAAGAAAALVAVGWLLFASRTPAELARSVQTVATLRPGSMQSHPSARFVVDDTVLADAPTALDLGDGTRLSLAAQTMLTVGERDGAVVIVARLGALRVERNAVASLLVVTPLGTLQLDGRASLAIRIDPVDYRTPFPTLTEEIHMQSRAVLLTTSLTLLVGAARLLDGSGAGELEPGRTVQDPAPGPDPFRTVLFDEVGTWTLQITDFVDGKAREPFEGIETCTAGPGGKWLFEDMESTRGARKIAVHIVISYDGKRQRYSGSLVDSFGGEMALLEGGKGADSKIRVLDERGFHGGAEDRNRVTMRGLGNDERLTTFETREGDTWVKRREMKHHRRR
ncbi:MAG: DUF1579 family protein [Planctomycetota bacterium]